MTFRSEGRIVAIDPVKKLILIAETRSGRTEARQRSLFAVQKVEVLEGPSPGLRIDLGIDGVFDLFGVASQAIAYRLAVMIAKAARFAKPVMIQRGPALALST